MGDHYCCPVCHQRYDCCTCAEDMGVDKTKTVKVEIPKPHLAQILKSIPNGAHDCMPPTYYEKKGSGMYLPCPSCNRYPCECTRAGWPWPPPYGPLHEKNKNPVITPEQMEKILNNNSDKRLMKTEAVKADSGKMDWSLLPIESVEEIIKVLEFGATKYDDWNWATGEGFKYTRVFNATMRHLWAWFKGEDNDPETGISHWAHAGCNVLFMLHFIKNKHRYNQDDRKFFKSK